MFILFLLFCIIEVFNICFCYNWELVPFICCIVSVFLCSATHHTHVFLFFFNFCSKWELVPFVLCYCLLLFLFRNTPLTFAVLCCHFSVFLFFFKYTSMEVVPPAGMFVKITDVLHVG